MPYLVKNYVANFPPGIYDVKIVVVFSEKYKEMLLSWEILCQSRGFKHFAFTSFEDALHYLTYDDDE